MDKKEKKDIRLVEILITFSKYCYYCFYYLDGSHTADTVVLLREYEGE